MISKPLHPGFRSRSKVPARDPCERLSCEDPERWLLESIDEDCDGLRGSQEREGPEHLRPAAAVDLRQEPGQLVRRRLRKQLDERAESPLIGERVEARPQFGHGPGAAVTKKRAGEECPLRGEELAAGASQAQIGVEEHPDSRRVRDFGQGDDRGLRAIILKVDVARQNGDGSRVAESAEGAEDSGPGAIGLDDRDQEGPGFRRPGSPQRPWE